MDQSVSVPAVRAGSAPHSYRAHRPEHSLCTVTKTIVQNTSRERQVVDVARAASWDEDQCTKNHFGYE